jgi:ribose transport system permease protein
VESWLVFQQSSTQPLTQLFSLDMVISTIAGCVMGGTSMAGGLASISGTVIGVFIIALLQEGILALGFTKDYQLIITGLIVIVAVFSDVVARRRKN